MIPSNRRLWALVTLVTTFLCLAVHVEGQRFIQPTCYSTTDDYVEETLIVPIQPQEPVTVRRYQGPYLRLFCISFEESGPTCTSTSTNAPQLCSRPVADSSVAFSCESLTTFSTNINSRITRGSVNGPDMIWLIRWDGTNQLEECFPKAVEARMMILVESAKVTSDAVLGIMVTIVILVGLLMLVSFYAFVAQRYRQIDEAGAITIGGPGANYRGPQMAIVGHNAAQVAHTKVTLPVREGDGALNDMRASKFGHLSQGGEEFTDEDILAPRGPRSRPSPPRPGDGVRDGMFPSPNNSRYGGGFSEEEDEDGYYSGYGSDGRRRRGGRGGRGRAGSGRRSRGAISPRHREGAQFPTQTDYVSGDGQGGEASLPVGVDGRYQSVKYIPRWMHGAFGRGGEIPDPQDGEEMDPTYQRADRDMTVTMGQSASKSFGVYGRNNSPRRGGGMEGDEENYGPGSGNRSGLKRRHGGRGLSEANTPNARRELGYDSEENSTFRGRRRGGRGGRSGPRGRLTDRLSRGYDDEEENAEEDCFQRNRARLTSGAELDPSYTGRAGSRGPNSSGEGGMDGREMQSFEGRNTTSTAKPGAGAFVCSACNVTITGAASDPVFCVANGDRHF